MVASIASKVLGSILGKYIDGLDKNNINVGIWSGNFTIENVALKKEISSMFDLPFNLKFNHIGKIKAKVPWKSLSTSAVEIDLEDLIVIAEPKSQADLMQIAVDIFKNRQKTLEIFAAAIEEKLKKGNKQDDVGYMQGLVNKIIDNVQISIKNIHVRFECSINNKHNFNFGVTLDSLSIYTTDPKGKKQFLDRSRPENAKLPVHKRLLLNDFSFYWNAKDLSPFVEIKTKREPSGKIIEIPLMGEEKNKVINLMKNSIPSGMGPNKTQRMNTFNYLLNLSIEAKMVQYKKTQELIDKNIPEVEIIFELDQLSSILSKEQFTQIMSLLDYFSDYLAMAKKETDKLRFKYLRPLKSINRSKSDTKEKRKKNLRNWWRFAYTCIKKQRQERSGFFTVLRMDKKQLVDYGEKFKMLFSKIDYNAGKEVTDFLTPDELDIYQVITMSVDENNLKKFIEDLLKEKQKVAKMDSKKGGWFGWGKSKNIELSAEEEKEIEDLIKQVATQEETKFKEKPGFNWLKIRFIQKVCNISLQRNNIQKQLETIENKFTNFQLVLAMRKSGMDMDLSLQNFEIVKKTEISKGNVVSDNIFRPLIETHNENKLVSLQFSTEPVEYVKKLPGKDVNLDMKLTLDIKSSEIIYNQKMIAALIDVFDTSADIEALRKAASEQADLINKQSQQKLNDILKTQKTVIVNISIAAPLIVLPFDQDEFITSECWVLSPGVLKIIGDNFNRDERTEEADHYDNFMIGLDNIRIEYLPSMLDYMEKYTPSQLKNTKNNMILSMKANKEQLIREKKISSFPPTDLLKNFSITLDLNILKPAYVQLQFDEPKFRVGAFISKLEVDLNQKIYADLLRFGDVFSNENSGIGQLQTDKFGLLKSCTIHGAVLRGNPLTGFAKVPEMAILSQGRLYFLKNAKDTTVYDFFSLKETRIKMLDPEESGHPFAVKITGRFASVLYLAFEKEDSRTLWFVKLETESKKLRIQAAPTETKTEVEKKEGESELQSTAPTKPVEPEAANKNTFVATVDLKMEELQVKVFDMQTEVFYFAISNLGIDVKHRDLETKVCVSLQKINIVDLKEKDPQLKTLISSEIGKSIATEVKGLGVDTMQTSKTLVSIDVALIDPKNPAYDFIEKDIDIKFGSLFVNIRPSQINTLMKFFIPPSEKVQEEDPVVASKTDSSTQNQLVVKGKKKLIKKEDDRTVQMKVKFSLERISVIMINEIKQVFLAHASISNIKIEFISKLTGMTLNGTLENLQLHDLTNYPNTLIESNFGKIVPTELFGIAARDQASSLIKLYFEKLNTDLVELETENVAGSLSVSVDQIKVNFYMQVIMRILDFTTGHLLPALNTEDTAAPAPTTEKKKKPETKTAAAAETDIPEEVTDEMLQQKIDVAVNNLMNPYWMKMSVDITQPIIILKCAPSFDEYLQIELGDIKIRNDRIQNRDRIISNRANGKHKQLGLGDTLQGIWTETFFISMSDMSIKRIIEVQSRKHFQYYMHPFNFNLSVEMVQFIDDYSVLFKALSDPLDCYTVLNLDEKKTVFIGDNSEHLLYFDGGMGVRARISPMIMVFGNAEFNFLMKSLFHNVTYNDFNDKNFQKPATPKPKTAPAKPHQTQKQLEPVIEEEKGGSMNISIDIDYIAMVTMDTQALSAPTFDEDRVIETRELYGKLFLKELRVEVMMKSNKEMLIGMYIRNLVGSYLQPRIADSTALDFLEKGFIGKMSVYNQFVAKTCDDLRAQVVSDLKNSISEKGETGSYGLSSYSKQNLMLQLDIIMKSNGYKGIKINLSKMRILAQTDVLLKLSGLAQMSPDCTPPEPPVDPEIKRLDLLQKAQEKEQRIKEIREYFNRKMLKASENSRSLSSISDNKFKQQVMMRIEIEVNKVIFVIPTKEHRETLVTSGDLGIYIEMNELKDINEIWEIQLGLEKSKKALETIESLNNAMKVNLALRNFQIFTCDFVQLLQNPWKKVPKRHILMPLKMVINYFDFNPVTKLNNELCFYSFKKIGGAGESLVFKVTLSDIDVLSRIAAFQMKLLEEGSPKKPDSDKQEMENPAPQIKDAIEHAIEKVDSNAVVDPLLQPANALVQAAPVVPQLPNKLNISDFKISGLQIFIINDDQKIFVPVLDFLVSNLHLEMTQTREMNVKLLLGLGVDYYNPSVSKWEPFIEKTSFSISVINNERNKISSSHIFVKLEDNDAGIENILNINLSTNGLSAVMRSLETFSNWNSKRVEEEKRIKASGSHEYLSHLQNIADSEEIVEVAAVEEQVEALLAEEEAKVDYVSPYLIKNLTGYPIKAEEYVNKTKFADAEKSADMTENPLSTYQSKNKKSKFKKEKLGNSYDLENEASLNLKLETGSKFMKGDEKLVLEEQASDTKLMVKILHDQYKIKTLEDLSLDQRYSKRRRLDGSNRILNEFSVVCDNFFDDKKKTLTISSTVLLENKTDIPVKFRILRKELGNLDIQLNPSQLRPVPFDMVASLYQLVYNDVGTKSSSLQQLTNKEDGYSQKIKLGEGLHVVARVKRDPEIFQRIIIVLLPIIKIKNCLPCALELRFEQDAVEPKETLLLPQANVQHYVFDPDNAIKLKTRVQGVGYSELVTIVDKQKDCDIEQITMKDDLGNETSIKLARISNSENLFTYYIYATAVLINETPLAIKPIYAKDNGSELKPVAGLAAVREENFNPKVTILNSVEANIKLLIGDSYLEENYKNYKNSQQTELLPLKGLDSMVYHCNVESKDNPKDRKQFELGVYMSPLFVDITENIYTKIVQVSPRNIFYNCTDHTIELRQDGSAEFQTIGPNQRSPYWWTDTSKDNKKLQVRIVNKNSKWSSKFDSKSLGSVPIAIQYEADQEIGQFYYEVKIDSAVEFTYFKEISVFDAYFCFRNESSKFRVQVYQQGQEEHLVQEVKPNTEIPYAWLAPDGKRVVVFKLSADGFQDTLKEVELSKINTNERIKIVSQDKQTVRIVNISVFLRKTTKFVKIRDVIDVNEEEKAEKKLEEKTTKSEFIFDMILQAIGFSLISPYQTNRIEPLYIHLGGIELFYLVTDHNTVVHARLKSLNIDNNTTPLSPFPVILTPSFSKKASTADFNLLTFKMDKRNESKPDIQLYDELAINIEPITLGIDDIALGIILDVVGTVQSTIAAKPNVRYQHKYFYISNDEHEPPVTPASLNNYSEKRQEWEIAEPVVGQTWIYAKDLKISVLDLTVSFKTRAQERKNQVLGFGLIFKSLGVALANVDEAGIKIKGLGFQHVFETTSSLLNKMMQHYKHNGLIQALKVVGSIDILGNPVNLFTNIGTGVVDFFEKPIEGLARGPLDAAKGLGQGTVSLLKNTSKGVFNTASKATGALSSGFSNLAMVDSSDAGRGVHQEQRKDADGEVQKRIPGSRQRLQNGRRRSLRRHHR